MKNTLSRGLYSFFAATVLVSAQVKGYQLFTDAVKGTVLTYRGFPSLDLHLTIFELIDMRSFSNLWFWIALAVLWSTSSHWVLGVPYDMIVRAKRHGGQAEVDLEDIVRVNVNRMLYIAQVSGLWILAFGCFVLTGLSVLGFFYDVEIAQALFLLGLPMAILGVLSLSTARKIEEQQLRGDALRARMNRHRLYTQLLGIVSIFVTAMWGMFQNQTVGVL